MERTLLVMRHAKSSWSSGVASDHDRPLNGRGRRDAPNMGAHLRRHGLAPEWVLSSDSQRTRETWDGVSTELTDTPHVRFEPSLYHGGYGDLRPLLTEVPADVQNVMALGHNPGWSDLVSILCGAHVSLTTANVAVLRIERPDWTTAAYAEGQWELVALYRPKTLNDEP